MLGTLKHLKYYIMHLVTPASFSLTFYSIHGLVSPEAVNWCGHD